MSKRTFEELLSEDDGGYAEILERYDSSALPELLVYVQNANTDPYIASRAVYAAAMIAGSDALEIITVAANHNNPSLRLAAVDALSLTNISVDAAVAQELRSLLSDVDNLIRELAQEYFGPSEEN